MELLLGIPVGNSDGDDVRIILATRHGCESICDVGIEVGLLEGNGEGLANGTTLHHTRCR